MPEDQANLAAGIRAALTLITGTKLDKAAKLSVSHYTLDRWSKGAGCPTPENLARLARLAGVEQDDIRNNTVGSPQ